MAETNDTIIEDNVSEENEDILYLKIPKEYNCVYKLLLIKLSQLGVDILNDCTAICGGQNKYIITCWNMFQAAIAAYELEEYKKADLLINYIKAQLKLQCEESVNPEPDEPIDPEDPTDPEEPDPDPDPEEPEDPIEPEPGVGPFTIRVIAENSTEGTVSGGGVYDKNTEITISATPKKFYRFKAWTDGVKDNPRNIIVTSNADYIARFEGEVRQILLGNTDDYTLDEFNELSIEEIFNLQNDTLNIVGAAVNNVSFKQNSKLHFLLIPIDLINVTRVSYVSNGQTIVLYDKSDEEGSKYNVIDRYETYNGINYRMFVNYETSGSISNSITLKVQNK